MHGLVRMSDVLLFGVEILKVLLPIDYSEFGTYMTLMQEKQLFDYRRLIKLVSKKKFSLSSKILKVINRILIV